MKKGLSLLLMTALLAGGTTGCLGGADTSAAGPEKRTEAQAETEALKQGETVGEEKLRVGTLLRTLTNEYWVVIADGIKEETESLGVEIEIMAAASKNDTGGQLQMLEDMVPKDYDRIGVAPITDINLMSSVAPACKKGIPAADLDQEFNAEELKNASGRVIGYCAMDYMVTGQQADEFLVGKVENQGKVTTIEGMVGNLSSESRKKGCTEVLEKVGIEIMVFQPCDWDRQKVMDAATNLANIHPDVIGIYCRSDTMALGAQQTVSALNLQGKAFVVGTNDSGEAIELIASGEIAETAAQRPGEIGVTRLRMFVDVIKSREIGDVNMELETELPNFFIISPENTSGHGN